MQYKIIHIKTKRTEQEGTLSFFENNRDIPFDIQRFYYIYGAQEKTKRGGHAHKKLKQMLFCPYGQILIELYNGTEKTEYLLDDPAKGLILEPGIWRNMIWEKKDSVLCVAASELYDEEDYIRDYDEYLNYLKYTHVKG